MSSGKTGPWSWYPTAHKRFYDGLTHIYRREDGKMERFSGKLRTWLERLCQTHKVVLTEDEWVPDAPPKRRGYLGVFDIADLEFEGKGAVHTFKLVYRYQETAR